MSMASTQIIEKKKQKEIIQDRNNTSRVVTITVYKESVKPRSTRKQSHAPIKKTKPNQNLTHGYDRRAQLLAHSRELRNHALGHAKKFPSSPIFHLQTKNKKKKGFWLTRPVRICSCSCSPSKFSALSFGSGGVGWCRYERVTSEESKERNRSNIIKTSQKARPSFLSKVNNMLKELSCKEI
ncbi:hypothetical protein PIB30_003056 [Stylosanthes scabra]|uniref:Uncharacterized protein n=1 Tax=Stylosanthes scabra TaxID=79078 RepID=A0ABU6X434_9FABA|nr:hypothetical protein [Stylosanthes scabra]